MHKSVPLSKFIEVDNRDKNFKREV